MQKILLSKYNPEWAQTFKKEKELLKTILGNKVLNIHHVGSTAVPGILAKSIIDIAIESAEYPPSSTTRDTLSSIGYEYKGESGVKGRIWFIKGQPRKFNLHYCSLGSKVIKLQIKFRDKLIQSEKLRREYEAIKLNNAEGKDIDSSEYALAKTCFIEKVIMG